MIGTKSETPSQTIGAFLMMHGVAPWEAEDLLRWLKADGFEFVPNRTDAVTAQTTAQERK